MQIFLLILSLTLLSLVQGTGDRFEIAITEIFIHPGDKLTFDIIPIDSRLKLSFGAIANRYKLKYKIDGRSIAPIDGPSQIHVIQEQDDRTKEVVEKLVGTIEVNALPSPLPRKIAICIVDTRPTRLNYITKDYIKACSKDLRPAPPISPDAPQEIEGVISKAKLVATTKGLFKKVPEYLQSNTVYDYKDLIVHVHSNLPIPANRIELFLKPSNSIGNFGVLEIPEQIVKETAEYDHFLVTFKTPQLSSTARYYKICVRLVEASGFLVKAERGCSDLIPVGE